MDIEKLKYEAQNKALHIADVSRRFSLDTNGYQEAKNWLKEIGQWEYVSTHGFSTDGYSIVEEANAIWNKRNQIN